jgi:hypothetical protein
MSLYNALFGYNKFAHILLRILDLDVVDVPRFRDCYLNEAGDEIIIFTRTGGGNREEYEAQNEALRKRPGFIADADDTLDVTYAKFRYSVPETYRTITTAIAEITKQSGEIVDPAEKFKGLLEKMQDPSTPKDDPQVAKAMDVGKKIFEQINDPKKRKDDSGIIEV